MKWLISTDVVSSTDITNIKNEKKYFEKSYLLQHHFTCTLVTSSATISISVYMLIVTKLNYYYFKCW